MSRRPTSPPHIAEQQRNRAKQDTKFPLRKGWFVVATDKYVTEPMTEEDARREFERQINVMGYPFVQLQIVDEVYSPLVTVEEYDNRASGLSFGRSSGDAASIVQAKNYHRAIASATDRDRRYLLERKLRGLNPRSQNPGKNTDFDKIRELAVSLRKPYNSPGRYASLNSTMHSKSVAVNRAADDLIYSLDGGVASGSQIRVLVEAVEAFANYIVDKSDSLSRVSPTQYSDVGELRAAVAMLRPYLRSGITNPRLRLGNPRR